MKVKCWDVFTVFTLSPYVFNSMIKILDAFSRLQKTEIVLGEIIFR